MWLSYKQNCNASLGEEGGGGGFASIQILNRLLFDKRWLYGQNDGLCCIPSVVGCMNNTELLTDCVDEPHLYGQFASQVYLIQVNTGFRPCRRTHVSRPKMVFVGLVATSNFRLCRHCAVSLVSWCAVLVISADCWLMGNESLPEIIINNRVNLFRQTSIRILVISSHYSFRVLFDKIASVYFIWKIYSYFSVGNGQPSEPALCQLYRHTFVPCSVIGCGGAQLVRKSVIPSRWPHHLENTNADSE